MFTTFIEAVAVYALVKAVAFLLIQNTFGAKYRKVTFGTVKRDILFTVITVVAVCMAWHWLLDSELAEVAVAVAGLVAARIAFREIKTLGGILVGDWSLSNPNFSLFGLGDAHTPHFSGGGRSHKYDDNTRDEDNFYYDARWYYEYGDGRNS